MNVLTERAAVVRYATTLKEASNVYVMMAMNYMMKNIVWVSI